MVTIEQIRAKIKEALQQSNMSQTELSKRLGIKQQQISCYLHEQKLPALDTLANLCVVLDLDANEILCVDTNK